MPETTTTYDAVLKDFYEGAIRDSLNNKVTLFNITNAAQEKVGGRQVLFPVHTNRNWGVGFRAERGTLPSASNETYVTATVSRKHYYARVELSSQVMKSSMGTPSAFADAFGETMSRVIDTTRRNLNQILYGVGDGSMGNVATGHATESTASLVTALATTGSSPAGNPLRFLEEGMIIDGLSASSALTETTTVSTDFTSATISSGTIAASGTATLVCNAGGISASGTMTVVSGTIFVLTGNGWNAFYGLDAGISNSGTYLGISRDARQNRGWPGIVDHNNGANRTLSLNIIQKAWDAVADATGDDDTITHLLMHTSVRREYISILQPDVRFMPRELRGGQSNITFTGNNRELQMAYEVDAPFNSIYGIDAGAWHFYKWSEFEWADEDGAVLHRSTSNIDSFDAFYRCFGNFATDQPRRNFVIKDISATL